MLSEEALNKRETFYANGKNFDDVILMHISLSQLQLGRCIIW